MKKLILITLILILQSFPSFGSPNGKGLICECILCPEDMMEFGTYYEGKNPSVYGYWLENDKVF